MSSIAIAAISGSNNVVIYSANSQYKTGLDDNWYIGGAIQLNSANSLETAPSGMTNVSVESSSGVWKSVLHDTNATQASNWPSTNVSVTTSAVWRTFVAQIFEVTGPSFGIGGGGLILARAMDGGYSG
jgi:hypothetical protein